MYYRGDDYFNLLWLFSASASTLLAPLYELLAQQIINQAQTALDSIDAKFVDNAQATVVLGDFQAALDSVTDAYVLLIFILIIIFSL